MGGLLDSRDKLHSNHLYDAGQNESAISPNFTASLIKFMGVSEKSTQDPDANLKARDFLIWGFIASYCRALLFKILP